MINFDEKTMTKATFNQSFVLSDETYGITKIDDDGDPAGEFHETEEGQECWILNNVECESLNSHEMVFVYIPEVDYATVVLTQYVDLANEQGGNNAN
ncbi:hypothetical protein [Vibrio phage vB_VpM-pA2SJ1]|uniref:Uncharacterized protein n=1 Tax=Vibrio phage vB_VpM-pA2SJ1 TaxID=3095964 RepID=A0AAX4J5V1_9CAUD